MATDRSLATLLRALQSASDEGDITRLLAPTTTLLTYLSNPLNISLLTAQILSAPTIWTRPDRLQTSFQVFNIYNSAGLNILQREEISTVSGPIPVKESLSKHEWVKAVMKGADDRSPPWRHLLVLGGLLSGFEGQNRAGLSKALRRSLVKDVVKASNFALQEVEEQNASFGAKSAVMVLGQVFYLFSDVEKAYIDHDLLLPTLVEACFCSSEGLNWGYFLSGIDADVVQSAGNKFDWSARSSTYDQLQRIAAGPLIASLGSLSRLAALSVERAHSPDLLYRLMDQIATFSRSLCIQWRQNKLSEIDITEEADFLTDEALQIPLPLMWRVLKMTMFTVVIILSPLLGRALIDGEMHIQAPFVAMKTLYVLRNLCFISSRLGANSFSQYTFIYLSATDILSKYPIQAEAFLHDIRPAELGHIPKHPLDRCHDRFFLDTAERFAPSLTAVMNEQVLIGSALPYLGIDADSRLRETFEAAHSLVLAVLAAPQNSILAKSFIPSYVETVFRIFPQNLSPRQFRLAIKTLVQIAVPPSSISQTQPLLSSVLLELVYHHAKSASTSLLTLVANQLVDDDSTSPTSEQAVMVLALVDCLPLLAVDDLEEWLTLTAESIDQIEDIQMRRKCRDEFWVVLSSGEMDVTRSALCVGWWTSRGGREMMLRWGKSDPAHSISGALEQYSKL